MKCQLPPAQMIVKHIETREGVSSIGDVFSDILINGIKYNYDLLANRTYLYLKGSTIATATILNMHLPMDKENPTKTIEDFSNY